MNELAINQVYRDIDRGRLLRVLFIATPEKHQVRKAIASCYSARKLTNIAADRLLNPARFERVKEAETVAMATYGGSDPT